MTEIPAKIVEMTPDHVDSTYYWLLDKELREKVDCLSTPTYDGNKLYWEKRLIDKSQKNYAILDENNKHIGNCGLINICINRNIAELWIYIAVSKGRGYGKTSVNHLLDIAFIELGLNQVSLRVIKGNTVAENLYKKLGFVLDNKKRNDAICNNKYLNSLWYSILSEEYALTQK